jgi:hypothetical protein
MNNYISFIARLEGFSPNLTPHSNIFMVMNGHIFIGNKVTKYGLLEKRRMECMSCPYYEDFTRICITSFPHITNYTSFETCESENHQGCLIYAILQKNFKCKYLERCVEDAVKNIPILVKYFVEDDKTINIFREIAEKYCTSELKHAQCANYKLFEQGMQPPLDLLPDGKKIRLRDFLLKKEITIE